MYKLLPLLAIFTLFLSCKTSSTSQANESLAASNGKAVVSGKILKLIDESAQSTACNGIPCLALVQIEQVHQASSNRLQPIAAQQVGVMRFSYGLSPTSKKSFPNLNKHYPGLKVGDRFKANVGQELIINNNEIRWVAYEYILLH